MNAIVDPFTHAAYCGACGASAVDLVHAHECCADPPDPPRARTVIAGALVLLALIYLFAFLPLAT